MSNILCRLIRHKLSIVNTRNVNGIYISELKCSRCGYIETSQKREDKK